MYRQKLVPGKVPVLRLFVVASSAEKPPTQRLQTQTLVDAEVPIPSENWEQFLSQNADIRQSRGEIEYEVRVILRSTRLNFELC